MVDRWNRHPVLSQVWRSLSRTGKGRRGPPYTTRMAENMISSDICSLACKGTGDLKRYRDLGNLRQCILQLAL
jgi:hypothetical protein